MDSFKKDPRLTFGPGHLLPPLRSFAVFLFFVSLFGLSVCFLAAFSPLRGIRYGVGDSDMVSRQSPLGLLLEKGLLASKAKVITKTFV